MKKLMFAAAALTAGFAMAEIVSSDIVGYAQSGLQSGATMLTPQFIDVNGSEAMSLDALTPVGDDVDTDGGITIQLLSSGGRTIASYMWIDWDGEPTGWCNDDFEVVNGISFEAGQGLWVTGTGSGASIQSAGKVKTTDAVVQLRSGATATGNPYPTTINLQDIIPEGDDVDGDGGITIQLLSSGGKTVASYMWIDWDGEPTGWCDDDFELVDGVSFTPGQGLWVTGTKTTEYLRFPAPEF